MTAFLHPWKIGKISAGNPLREYGLGLGRFLERRRRLDSLDSEKLMRTGLLLRMYDVNEGRKRQSSLREFRT